MIRALIIDDIEKARIALRSDLENYCSEVRIAGEADGVESGIKAILNYAPDLVFLDIRMADGSGFDIIEKLRTSGEKVPAIIFTTAYDEYAIKAFKFSALDYLLKPVDPDDLKRAIDKLDKQKQQPGSDVSLSLLMEKLKGGKEKMERIALNSTEKVQVVNIRDIVRCESQRNYTLFYLIGNKQILVTRTLKDFEDMLEESNFLRVHHSHLINMAHLKEYVKSESVAVMTDSSNVPVSVRKKDHLMKLLGI